MKNSLKNSSLVPAHEINFLRSSLWEIFYKKWRLGQLWDWDDDDDDNGGGGFVYYSYRHRNILI